MVDWLVQVLRVFDSQSTKTFFLAVSIMDRYFRAKQEQKLRIRKDDLHEIGLVSLFISIKLEESQAVEMESLLTEAGHNKFSRSVILQRERDILRSLQFKLYHNNDIYEDSVMFLNTLLRVESKLKTLQEDQCLIKSYLLFGSHLVFHSLNLTRLFN